MEGGEEYSLEITGVGVREAARMGAAAGAGGCYQETVEAPVG